MRSLSRRARSSTPAPAGRDLPGVAPPAATGRGPAADSGRLLCGKKPDGPTEGRILVALGRCARPGRTLRACRLITGLALEINRRPPSLPCGVLRGCGEDGVSSTKPSSEAHLRFVSFGRSHLSADARQRAPRQRGLTDSEASQGGRAAANAQRDAEPEPSRPQVARRQARGRGLIPRSSRPGRSRSTPAATGREPPADSGRHPCGKQPDGPTEGRIHGALGRCARPGRTLRAWRLITGLALEIRRRPPACRAGCFAAAARMA